MFDWLREAWKMRGFVRVKIMKPVDVTEFLNLSQINLLVKVPLGLPSLNWVSQNIRFVSDATKDVWNNADETLNVGCGDCEDGAILLACLILARNKLIPYYQILVNVYDTPQGFHAAVTVYGELRDWTWPTLKTVPTDWKLKYCFNRKHSYASKEYAWICKN